MLCAKGSKKMCSQWLTVCSSIYVGQFGGKMYSRNRKIRRYIHISCNRYYVLSSSGKKYIKCFSILAYILESLMETKPCCLPWWIINSSTSDLLPSAQRNGCVRPFPEPSTCLQHTQDQFSGPLDSMAGRHSVTGTCVKLQRVAGHWHSAALPCYPISFSFLSSFFDLGVPL